MKIYIYNKGEQIITEVESFKFELEDGTEFHIEQHGSDSFTLNSEEDHLFLEPIDTNVIEISSYSSN